MRVKRFTKGELLTAARLNELIVGINSNELHAGSNISLYRSTGGTTINAFERNEGVPFYNSSGSTCPAYGVLALTGIALGTGMPFYFTADKPGTTFYRYFIVNGPESVASSATGVGYIVNGSHNRVCIAAYDSGSPAAGEEWGVKPSQFTLSKGYPGCFTVLGILDSTNKWMLGYLHPINKIIGKLAGTLSQGGSATVNVWESSTPGTEAVISSLTVTARDWLMKSGATAIASGKKVVVEWINGVPYVTEAECA